MRFLGVGHYNDLASMYHSMAARGHEVRVFVEDKEYQEIFRGMLQFTQDWRRELAWIREADNEGIIIFESADKGYEQEALRKEGFRVIGGSELGDRLEGDREFGQQALRAVGLKTASSHVFKCFNEAISLLERSGGRFVLKFNGTNSPRTRNYIGQLDDSADMLAVLKLYRDHSDDRAAPDFVLMEYVQGVEVGVGAYFNGQNFLDTVCIDFEHKRFFPGDLGELTGEMGTIVSYRGAQKLFNATLSHMRGLLSESGYCGYINVNLIVNEHGIWPLEFTSRFGYPGFAICETLHLEPWETIFRRMLDKNSLALPTKDGYAAGVVLTVPPFPYSDGYEKLSKGEPICFRPGLTEKDLAGLHFAEIEKVGEQLVTSGATGYVGVVTGQGQTIAHARDEAYRLARHVIVPNLRYRSDIGERLISHDLQALNTLGWL